MAGGNLSPRQKMINMMYLVLTALLALNVSKEVLNSFFEVNLGLVKTTETLDEKSNNTYKALNEFNNKEKSKPYIELTDQIIPKANDLAELIQAMKYDLVYAADAKKVYLGEYDDGAEDEENEKFLKKEILFKDLLKEDKNKKIAWLNAKDNRDASSTLFNPDNKKNSKYNIDGKGRATILKERIVEFKLFLLDILSEAEKSTLITEGAAFALISEINNTLEINDGEVYGKKGNRRTWEYHNFYDMPAVGALTLLSKWQADIKNIEGEVAAFLADQIDATDLKFSSAIATTIPASNFVTIGDDFKSQIFLSAYDSKLQPQIYIGEYDSSEVNGEWIYTMQDQTTPPLEVADGKGEYVIKTRGIGPKNYKGIIKIVQDKGFKTYSFRGNYVVASKGAVASPTNMNVLYQNIENPIQVSVAGYLPSQISISCNNGSYSVVNKREGKYTIKPTRLTNEPKPIISLSVTVNGKKIPMGSVKFKVFEVPNPVLMIGGKKGGLIPRSELMSGQQVIARMENFPFDREALSFQVVEYTVLATFKGDPRSPLKVSGARFNDKVKEYIRTTSAGGVIIFRDVKVKMRNNNKAKVKTIGSLVYTIK